MGNSTIGSVKNSHDLKKSNINSITSSNIGLTTINTEVEEVDLDSFSDSATEQIKQNYLLLLMDINAAGGPENLYNGSEPIHEYLASQYGLDIKGVKKVLEYYISGGNITISDLNKIINETIIGLLTDNETIQNLFLDKISENNNAAEAILKNLVEIKKNNPEFSIEVFIGDPSHVSYFDAKNNKLMINTAQPGLEETIFHESIHAIHQNKLNNLIPENFDQLLNNAKNNIINVEKLVIDYMEKKYNEGYTASENKNLSRESFATNWLAEINNNGYGTIGDILDIVSNGEYFQKEVPIMLGNKQTKMTLPGHRPEYYKEHQLGTERIKSMELLAGFGELKLSNNTEALDIAKQLLGEELYNTIDSMYIQCIS